MAEQFPLVLAITRGWPGAYRGVVQLVRFRGDLAGGDIAVCDHRHRRMSAAKECAQRLLRKHADDPRIRPTT